MATLEQRLKSLITVIGADIKANTLPSVDFVADYNAVQANSQSWSIGGAVSGPSSLPDVDFVANVNAILNS